MKKLFAVLLAISFAVLMNIAVCADGEIQIPLDPDHLTGSTDYFAPAEDLTFADGTVNADNVEIIAFALPQNVNAGENVTVHIKGTSDGDFRVWLICSEVTSSKGDHATFSNQWKASENGFTSGEFDYEITLNAYDAEPVGGTQANKVCFKAPAAHGILENLTVTYLGITYASAEDIEANTAKALEEIQPYVDQYEAALAAAKSADGDTDILEQALADAKAAAEAISASEGASLGYPSVTALIEDAEKTVKEIENLISGVNEDILLASIQEYIDSANAALETAKNAGSDVAAVENALVDANSASDYVVSVANKYGYDSLMSASRDLRAVIKEIESILDESKELKAKEDAEAAAQAEKDAQKAEQTRRTTTIAVIAVAAVIVIAVVAAVILGVLKKKKK